MKLKGYFRIAILVVLILSLYGYTGAQAQGGLTYDTGIQVQNLSSGDAAITLYYYNSNGTQEAAVGDTIPANSSKTYFPLTGVPDGWKGSMVITSNQPLFALDNLVANSMSFGAATTSFSAGSTTFSLPLVMCNNAGFNTFFNIQNTGTGPASVTVNYIPGSYGLSGQSDTATIAAGAAKTFDQEEGSAAGTKTCTQLKDATGKFIGSVQITSDQPVVASLMQLNHTNWPILMGYNGFADGSTTVNAPLIMSLNNGFYTGMQIQNVGSVATHVDINYATNTVGAFNPTDEACDLAAGQSCTLIQNTGQWVSRYIGAATITNTAGQKLVVIVNQVSNGGPGFGPFGTAYEGFNPAVATDKVSAPLIMANNSSYYTGIQVQNVGVGTCASVVIDYGPNVAVGGTFNPVSESFSLTAGASKTIIQNGSPAANGGVNDWVGVGKYIGSAEISGSGCSLVSIINEVSFSTGDKFFTYDGLNY